MKTHVNATVRHHAFISLTRGDRTSIHVYSTSSQSSGGDSRSVTAVVVVHLSGEESSIKFLSSLGETPKVAKSARGN